MGWGPNEVLVAAPGFGLSLWAGAAPLTEEEGVSPWDSTTLLSQDVSPGLKRGAKVRLEVKGE